MSKTEAEILKKIQIWSLKKRGFLNGWVTGELSWTQEPSGLESSIRADVSTFRGKQFLQIHDMEEKQSGMQEIFYKIPLTTTPCFFGGIRYWFVCPWYSDGNYCGKRVGVLYKGGKYFACRHCYNLTYRSRKLSGYWKTIGVVVSITELQELEEMVGRRFYAGKMTRRYKSYLKKEQMAVLQMSHL